jgi:hypothetical protein
MLSNVAVFPLPSASTMKRSPQTVSLEKGVNVNLKPSDTEVFVKDATGGVLVELLLNPKTITYRVAARTTVMPTSKIVAITGETPSASYLRDQHFLFMNSNLPATRERLIRVHNRL